MPERSQVSSITPEGCSQKEANLKVGEWVYLQVCRQVGFFWSGGKVFVLSFRNVEI